MGFPQKVLTFLRGIRLLPPGRDHCYPHGSMACFSVASTPILLGFDNAGYIGKLITSRW